jgi:hypothetical protein
MPSRRILLRTSAWAGLGTLATASGVGQAAPELPFSTRFKGVERFQSLVARAQRENWADLPMGERVARFGKAMHKTPYVSFTLEIDDHVEAPSANFLGLDCWSFFEISLGLARMIARRQPSYAPEDLLREIRFTRYRGGICTGNYLQRIHYLAEWYFDNEARGTIENLTRKLGHAQPILGRKCQEMTILWKSYRYLRNNPDLRAPMAKLEETISQLPVHCIPKDKVHLVEPNLKNGDILGIATKYQGGFCSHVGLAYRSDDGVMRLMHASSQKEYKRVVIDKSVSQYLKSFSGHLGILVGRPRELDATVTDPDAYRANLERLTGGKGVVRDRIG